METKMMPPQKTKFSQTITAKAIMIGILTLLMLIPSAMIENLIEERQRRNYETIDEINRKWSQSQEMEGVLLTIPYIKNVTDEKNERIISEKHTLTVTPKILKINAELNPKEKYYGIYKTILYQSIMDISGEFAEIDLQNIDYTKILWEEAYFTIGLSDLKGVQNEINFQIDGKTYHAQPHGNNGSVALAIMPKNSELFQSQKNIHFSCVLKLNGSSNLNFVPVGKITEVTVTGKWQSPGFIGNFSPESTVNKDSFQAKWSILDFNRNIPQQWIDRKIDFSDTTFGVNLVNTVDHYQQNMRSTKYSLMFIVLTFVVFFFVEIFTKKRINPVQYLLVGIALILFYSLLLSFSEQIGFALAYLIASIATIGLISSYAHSIFKSIKQTTILSGILVLLYTFLFVILQLEDVALLIGSVGLFIILGLIMYISKKVNWYKIEDQEQKSIR